MYNTSYFISCVKDTPCTSDDLETLGSENPTSMHKIELLRCKEICFGENVDYEDTVPMSKENCLKECISGIHAFDNVSPLCNTCLSKFVTCVVTNCDHVCLTSTFHPRKCEECAEKNKCQISTCSNPIYSAGR